MLLSKKPMVQIEGVVSGNFGVGSDEQDPRCRLQIMVFPNFLIADFYKSKIRYYLLLFTESTCGNLTSL